MLEYFITRERACLTYDIDIFSVKPAVFDLFLALGIAGYLLVIYVVVQVRVVYVYLEQYGNEKNSSMALKHDVLVAMKCRKNKDHTSACVSS